MGTTSERIATLDVIRGVAVMGIFSVNVIAFAMFDGAYFNPGAYGGHQGLDLWLWATNLVLIDGKMRSLFSMLFGASMLLVVERAAANGQSPTSVHVRRMLVLLLFGLLHFYLIWFGDILVGYALVGLIAFLFRRRSPVQLMVIGCLCLLLNMLMFAAAGLHMVEADRAAHAVGATAKQVREWNAIGQMFYPSAGEIARDMAVHASFASRLQNMLAERALEPLASLTFMGLETLGLMLLGMAGYRSGFLTGAWADRSYRRVAVWALVIGAAAFAALAVANVASRFYAPLVFGGFVLAGLPFRVGMAWGYAALIILLARNMGPFAQRLAATGRCAFSNYLGTSILAAFLFYGWGLGLYGQLSRWQAWAIAVPPIWLLMLAWSKPWLERFNYGPLEWAWRSLARGKVQPLRRLSTSRPVLAAGTRP